PHTPTTSSVDIDSSADTVDQRPSTRAAASWARGSPRSTSDRTIVCAALAFDARSAQTQHAARRFVTGPSFEVQVSVQRFPLRTDRQQKGHASELGFED